MKQKANVNVYLVIYTNSNVLLSKRRNTGYEDGNWSLVAGHVEQGESVIAALIREALEEIGIEITAEHCTVSHIMHRKTDRENVDVFIKCQMWKGQIENKEPNKCECVEFFPVANLPTNTVPYIKHALLSIQHNQFYSEVGWLNN